MINSTLATDASGAGTTPEALVDEYCERVHRFAAMVSRGDQDSSDLAQEALARALRQYATYDPTRGPLSAWLWAIVVNVARDAGRAKVRQNRLLDRLRRADGGTAEVASLAVRRIEDNELLGLVRRLPRRQRTLIALRFGGDLSYTEIGLHLGITPAAATMATRRALDRLRASLEDTR